MKWYGCMLFTGILIMTSCTRKLAQGDPVPEHETFTIQSQHVGELRTINVWMPYMYQSGRESYDVLYMADGGVKEDFPHIANTLNELIRAKKIAPVILVGIENTQRRRDLTGPTNVEKDKEIAPVVGGSASFSAFIKDELFPEITERYRTTARKGLIGESLAGLFVIETFLLHPEMFDYFIAFDPSLWWNERHLVKTAGKYLSAMPPGMNKKLWFAASGAKDMGPIVSEFSKILETISPSNLVWKYSFEPQEEHHTIFRATKEKALIWTMH